MKLVIFDCDGTLVDSQHIIAAAMARAFAAHGLAPLPRRQVLAVVGLSLPKAVATLLPEATPAEVAGVSAAYRAAFHDLRQDPAHHEPTFPGALEALADLGRREDIVLGIATGKSRRGVAVLLERLGLAGRFRTVQTADTHPSKPHPAMVLAAIAETGADPARSVMIGDTTYDIAMARDAAIAAVGVAWGYHPVLALERAGAHVIAGCCADLAPAIDRALACSGAAA